jgi:hypothetical protein
MQPSKIEAFWRRHVEAWRSSGLTQKHFRASGPRWHLARKSK